jgi:two-component system, cell cycle response regulator DivK
MDDLRAVPRRGPTTERAGYMSHCTKAEQPSPRTSGDRLPRRALVVEPEPATLRLCRDVLESFGFVVDAVDSGIAAVMAARKELPDLILMDLQLRDVPGREAILWLRSNPALCATPIIVLANNAESAADLPETGPGASLRKPVSSATVQRAIYEVLK